MAALSARRVREPVVIAAKQNNFFPQAFVWRGQRHDVRAVESCRTEVRRDWQGKVESHHFRVRTEGAVFDLTQDLACDTWQLEGCGARNNTILRRTWIKPFSDTG